VYLLPEYRAPWIASTLGVITLRDEGIEVFSGYALQKVAKALVGDKRKTVFEAGRIQARDNSVKEVAAFRRAMTLSRSATLNDRFDVVHRLGNDVTHFF
jgi:hypothetical protein